MSKKNSHLLYLGIGGILSSLGIFSFREAYNIKNIETEIVKIKFKGVRFKDGIVVLVAVIKIIPKNIFKLNITDLTGVLYDENKNIISKFYLSDEYKKDKIVLSDKEYSTFEMISEVKISNLASFLSMEIKELSNILIKNSPENIDIKKYISDKTIFNMALFIEGRYIGIKFKTKLDIEFYGKDIIE